MSPVTKWQFRGTQFELNPFQDSGWTKEMKIAEVDLIDSNITVIQTSGNKSRRRTIRGFLLTAGAVSQFWNWFGQEGYLIDDLGNDVYCRLVAFEPERVFDIKNWRTRRYSATFVER